MSSIAAGGTSRRAWLPGFVVLAAIWGSGYLFIKIGVGELHPVHLSAYRLATAAVAMLVLLAVLRDRLPTDPRTWLHLTVVAMFQLVLPLPLLAYSEQRIDSLLAAIWNATSPLVVLPMAVLLFRTERLDPRRAVGLGVGFAGVLVVLGVWQGVGGAHLTGQLLAFAAAACFGFAIPYQRRFLADSTHSELSLTAGQLLVGAVLMALLVPTGGTPPAPTRLSVEVLASVLVLGVFATGFAFVLNMRLIRQVGASLAASVMYVIPIFAVVAGVLFLDERLTWYQPVGALVVLVGVMIIQGGAVRWRRVRSSLPSAGDVVSVAVPTPSVGPPATS
ncbi:DMT family transporter [Micromonospora sp. NPDC000207]|uniref:DMT family transporter n=1 Tax=Micromonospora sp. NPDC000207 TaxID=3154246 RepID=UPI00331E6E21